MEEAKRAPAAEISTEMQVDPVDVAVEILKPGQSEQEVPLDVGIIAPSPHRSASKDLTVLSLCGC